MWRRELRSIAVANWSVAKWTIEYSTPFSNSFSRCLKPSRLSNADDGVRCHRYKSSMPVLICHGQLLATVFASCGGLTSFEYTALAPSIKHMSALLWQAPATASILETRLYCPVPDSLLPLYASRIACQSRVKCGWPLWRWDLQCCDLVGLVDISGLSQLSHILLRESQ